MKLTNTKKIISKKGMTLIELTVVILVLLSLMSVLFIGARAWLRGSDRASAALLIRNAQQGVRSHANIMGVDTPPAGTNIPWPASTNQVLSQEVFGPGKYVESGAPGDDGAGNTVGMPPAHPVTGRTFIAGATSFETVPGLGTPYMTTNAGAAGEDPATFYIPDGLQ